MSTMKDRLRAVMWALNGHEYKGVITSNGQIEYSNLSFVMFE